MSSTTLRFAPSHVSWTDSQEKALAKDYPFIDIANETPADYVVRMYLQTLWLPESIFSLSALIPSLQRVNVASSSNGPHPLVALLAPILLNGRAAADKYSVTLPQVIADGGASGDVEEVMMWYSLSYEKNDSTQSHSKPGTTERMEELASDEKWLSQWLERMEKREISIQLLLHMLVLSLPGIPEHSSTKKRKRPVLSDTPTPEAISQDILEARAQIYVDKLSTWQLVSNLEHQTMDSDEKDRDGHDWAQKLLLNVIQPQFKPVLPNLYEEIHSKLFPHSHFMFVDNEDSSNSDYRSSSPMQVPDSQPTKSLSQPPPRKRVKTSGTTRHASPALSVTSTSNRADQVRERSSLARSRSLSVTLAQERAQSVGNITKKRVLNREVSMSRVFRGKSKTKEDQTAKPSRGSSLKPQPSVHKDEGNTLVDATPVKSRPSAMRRQATAPAHFPQTAKQEEEDEEEIWNLPSSSPDFLLLGPTSQEDDDDVDMAPATPTRRRVKC